MTFNVVGKLPREIPRVFVIADEQSVCSLDLGGAFMETMGISSHFPFSLCPNSIHPVVLFKTSLIVD